MPGVMKTGGRNADGRKCPKRALSIRFAGKEVSRGVRAHGKYGALMPRQKDYGQLGLEAAVADRLSIEGGGKGLHVCTDV